MKKIFYINNMNPQSEDWSLSAYEGDLIVRANNIDEALRLVQEKYSLNSPKRDVGTYNPIDPWSTIPGTPVQCIEIISSEVSKYSLDGESTVLAETPRNKMLYLFS